MSWTAPVTRATGYIVLATDWNAVQNNLLLLDRIYAKKTTAKTVNGTTTATDLLNGEFTVAAGDMGTDRILRLTAWGDWKQNSGADRDVPGFRFALGASTILDSNNTGGNNAMASATRYGWRIVCEIQNLGATNSQQANLSGELALESTSANPVDGQGFATGNGAIILNTAAGGPGTAGLVKYEGQATSAVDTTAACALTLKVVNNNSSANYETKLLGALVELL